MRILKLNSLIFLILTKVVVAQDIGAGENLNDLKPQEVKQIMKKVADWQIEHYNDIYNIKYAHDPLNWTNGALYIGMVKWASLANDNTYYEWLKSIGEKHDWKLAKRQYHADDHTVGQMYFELYRKYKDENMIKPTKEQFDFITFHRSQSSLKWKSIFHQDRWNWCDALFMAPPVLAKLYKTTGNKRYLDFLMSEYKATTDLLFDKKENLYYRDDRYITKLDNGTKVFWSRGNGWVFAGLVNIMDELNPETKEYKYFLNIYKKMAKAIIKLQTPEGHWAMSLLGQKYYPIPETSGSSFFIFGLAWGINNGILDAKTYKSTVKKGWDAMTNYVTEEGMLGYVQPRSAAPGKAWADKTEVYGTGAFLCAGTEIYKLYGGE